MSDILKPWKISTISFQVFCPALHIWNLFSVFDLTTDTGRKMLVSHCKPPEHMKMWNRTTKYVDSFYVVGFHVPASLLSGSFFNNPKIFFDIRGKCFHHLHSVNVAFSTFSDKIYGRTRIGWEIRYLAFRKFRRRSM